MKRLFEHTLEKQAEYFGVDLIREDDSENETTGSPQSPVGSIAMGGQANQDASPNPQQGAQVPAPSYDKPLRELASLTWSALETDFQGLDEKIKIQLQRMKEGATSDENKATSFFGFWQDIVNRGKNKPQDGFGSMVREKAERYKLDLISEIDGAGGAGGAMNMDASQQQVDPNMQTGEVDQAGEQQPPQPPQFDKPLHFIAGLTYAALEIVDGELEETAKDKIYNLKGESMKNDQQAAMFFKQWESIVDERNGVIPDDER